MIDRCCFIMPPYVKNARTTLEISNINENNLNAQTKQQNIDNFMEGFEEPEINSKLYKYYTYEDGGK